MPPRSPPGAIRIGTAVLIAPFWDPVHLAEQATVVDLLSGGRLELGVGAGYRAPEYRLFGRSPKRAGRLGEGLLSVSPDLHEPYLSGLRAGGHPVERLG